jgi:hypothetical protein
MSRSHHHSLIGTRKQSADAQQCFFGRAESKRHALASRAYSFSETDTGSVTRFRSSVRECRTADGRFARPIMLTNSTLPQSSKASGSPISPTRRVRRDARGRVWWQWAAVSSVRAVFVGVSLLVVGFVVPAGTGVQADESVVAPVVERAAFVSSNTSRCVAVSGGLAGDVAVVNITNTAATGNGYGALRASGTTPLFDRPAREQLICNTCFASVIPGDNAVDPESCSAAALRPSSSITPVQWRVIVVFVHSSGLQMSRCGWLSR